VSEDPADHQEAELGEESLSIEQASDVSTVVRGGALQIAGQFSQRILQFLFGAVAFRFLGQSGFGVYQIVLRVFSIAAQLGLGGFNYATMRFMAQARVEGDHSRVRGAARLGVACTAILSLGVTGLMLVWLHPLADFFSKQPSQVARVEHYMRVGAAYVPLFALMQIFRYVTQSYKTMRPSVITGNVVQPAARFVMGVALLAAGFGVAGATFSLAASAAVGALVGGWYYVSIFTPAERAATPHFSLGRMLRFSIPQTGASLLGIQTLGLGVLILGHFSTHAQAGLFGAALALQAPGNIFLGGIVNIWAPVVSDLYDRGAIARLESLYQTINRWIATFSFPVFAALIVMPAPFAHIYGGAEALDAASVVAVLAAGNVFYTGTGPTGYVLSMTGRPGVNFVNSLVSVVLYVVAGAVVVPEHGALGMAAVDAGVTALINTARVVEARLLVGVQPYGRSFSKPVVATAAGAAVLLAWKAAVPGSLWPDLAGVAVAGAVYVVVLRALGLDAEERYVWNRIRRRAFKGRRGGRS
jgi:O-antigen/teichoic acid export membrane protein